MRFRYDGDVDRSLVTGIAEDARERFEGMPGLRNKFFTVDAENREAINFYVWESIEAAQAFFTEELLERVTGLYGVRPTLEYVEIPVLVDNSHRYRPPAGCLVEEGWRRARRHQRGDDSDLRIRTVSSRMKGRGESSPQIGTPVEMLRPGGAGNACFERAVVVDRLTDIAIGLVLEIQFEDSGRVQRVWPSPAIRLLA